MVYFGVVEYGSNGMQGRRSRQDGDGASRDLIEMLPTCKYSSASAPPKQLGKFGRGDMHGVDSDLLVRGVFV